MKMKTRNKALLLTFGAVLLVAASVLGTLAWLTAETNEVKNIFTVGNINITLTETTTDFKMVPGCTIAKDPKVTVLKDSEACWLFVKIVESENLDSFITYNVAGGWIALEGVESVYYRKVDAETTKDNVAYQVLMGEVDGEFKDGFVTVNDTVTKADMDALTTATQPTLTFTAYACQLYKSNGEEFAPAEAWTQVSTSTTP